MKLSKPFLWLLVKSVGTIPGGYFKDHPGIPGFFPWQLQDYHRVDRKSAVLLSLVCNYWLHTIDRSALTDNLKRKLRDCTWIYSGRRERRPVEFRCQLKICPWCTSLRVLRADRLLRTLKPKGYVERWNSIDQAKSVFSRPRTTRTTLFAVRGIQPLVSVGCQEATAVAVFFTKEHTKGFSIKQGQSLIRTVLRIPPESVISPDFMDIYPRMLDVKSVTEQRSTQSRGKIRT